MSEVHARPRGDVVVLGCGVAGLSAAHQLSAALDTRLVVLEENASLGGNQRSFDVGDYTFDNGAFYYWSGMPFFEMFPGVRARCQRQPIHVQRLTPRGEVQPFPFSLSNEVLGRGPGYWLRAGLAMSASRISLSQPNNAEDYVRHYMGDRLYQDLGMEAYLERFYGIAANQIELEFARARLASVRTLASPVEWAKRLSRRLRAVIARHEAPQPDTLVRPRAGFHAMYEPAVTALRERGCAIELGNQIHRIESLGRGLRVHTERATYRADFVVNTLPLPHIAQLLSRTLRSDIHVALSDLVTVFVSFRGERSFSAPIFYNFGQRGIWKRLTMMSDYYGLVGGRAYASVEVPRLGGAYNEGELALQTLEELRGSGAFRGDLRLEGVVTTRGAYPALVHGASTKAGALIAELGAMGVVSTGRQGGFAYLPTGRHVVHRVRDDLGAGE